MRFQLVIVLTIACSAIRPIPHDPSLTHLIEVTNEVHRPLIVMFSAWWCTPCREFKRNVLADSRVQAALVEVAFVDLDVDGENGSAATKRCGVRRIPDIVGIGRDGVVKTRWENSDRSGEVNPATVDEFLAFLRQTRDQIDDRRP